MNIIERFGEYGIYRDSSSESAGFYCRTGRFFADATIRKELGGPLTNSPSHIWLLAADTTEQRDIVAVSGCRLQGKVAWFTETYVCPEHRRRGLFARLFELKYALCVTEGAQRVRGIANSLSRPMFEQHGWRVTSVRGSWTYYEKEVEHDSIITV